MPEDTDKDAGNLLTHHRLPLIILFCGLMAVAFGIRLIFMPEGKDPVQFSETATNSATLSQNMRVDVEGAVEKPGVYELLPDSRVQDLLVKSGGLTLEADRQWIEKHLNLAAKLIDGTKIYIPRAGESSQAGAGETADSGSLNINSASTKELEDLPGIGPVTAEKIIQGRPYGSVEELLTKKVVSQSVYSSLKDKISTY